MPMDYEPQRETRIYRRPDGMTGEAAHTRQRRDERIGSTQPMAQPKGLMNGISIAQVIAGAAAAATSMLLSSKIGIAGSVIGAAVSSAITIICSQLYRRALDASAEKLKSSQQAANAYAAKPEPSPSIGAHAARVAPTKLRARAAAKRSAEQRKVVILSAVLAVATVAITAAVILATTAGEGLGTRTQPIFRAPAEQRAESQAIQKPEVQPEKPEAQEATPENPRPQSGQASQQSDPSTEPDSQQQDPAAPSPSTENGHAADGGNGDAGNTQPQDVPAPDPASTPNASQSDSDNETV